MEEVSEQLDNNMQKIRMLENFISLSLRRHKIAPEVRACFAEAEKVRKLMEETHEIMGKEMKKKNQEYKKVMQRIHQQQVTIMEHVLSERRRKIQEAEQEDKLVKEVLSGSAKSAVKSTISKSLMHTFSQMQLNRGAVTPKMTIHDYKESPLVKKTRINTIPISFLEFQYQVTPQLFNTIPKYMRGRETIDELNSFLETTIIPCFNEKYQLLHRQRSTVRNPNELELWKVYHEQAGLIPGSHFITPGEISRRINKMIDKKSQNRITMLRHIGVLQEQRITQTVCYIWVAQPVTNTTN